MVPATRVSIRSLSFLFLGVATFWALFDQIGSSWVLQAQQMDRTFTVPYLGSVTLLPSQLQGLNPLLIIIFTPLFAWGVYPYLIRRGLLSVKGRVVAGMMCATFAFLVVALAQHLLVAGHHVSVAWQCVAYVVITIAEVLVSVTTLQLAYTAAPHASTSLMTSLYLLSVSLGNAMAALYNRYLSGMCGGPETVSYYLVFATLPLLGACIVIRAGRFQGE
jgi:POT family proton-dependent oligopeptide transporter